MTPLNRKITGEEWENIIRPGLRLPLTREQAALDLSFLARAGKLARPVGRSRAEWRGLGAEGLAIRWGWDGDAGARRARRLLTDLATWVDPGLRSLSVFVRWAQLRAGEGTGKGRTAWERYAFEEQERDDVERATG